MHVCVHVCVNCAKYKEIPSQAAEFIWGHWSPGSSCLALSPHFPPMVLCGSDVPITSVSTDLTQWWLGTLLCSSKQVTLPAKCHCTPKMRKSLGQDGM